MNKEFDIFIENKDFIGSIESGHIKVEYVQVNLQYSEFKPVKITGTIHGNSKKHSEMLKIYNNRSNDNHITMYLESELNHSGSFILRNVNFHPVHLPDGKPKEYFYNIAEFEANNIEIIQLANIKAPRTINFFLCGNEQIWGNHKLEYKNGKIIPTEFEIRLNRKLPFKVFLVTKMIGRTSRETFSLHYRLDILTVKFILNENQNGFNDENFNQLARDVLDNILLLVSFIAKKRISWFSYIQKTSQGRKSIIKSNVSYDVSELDFFDLIVRPNKIIEFIETCYSNFSNLKVINFDISNALKFYISSFNLQYIESKFTFMFSALEYLSTLFVDNKNLSKIVPRSKYEKSKKQLKNFIKESNQFNDKQSSEIIKKIPELNRYSFSTIINFMCVEMDFNLSELYPKNSEVSLFNTRNNLIHQLKPIDIDFLVIEFYRLKFLIERVVLYYLGWSEFSNLNNSPFAKLIKRKINEKK